MRAALVLVTVLASAPAAAQNAAVPGASVVAEFRVFAGSEEITASTRLRLMPSGEREKAVTIEPGPRPSAVVTPGIYDVQALRMRGEGVVGIKWAERLVLMYYPDEEGRHLEVINFEPGYGALQVRASTAGIHAYDVAVFPARDRTVPAGTPVEGDGYRLFVLQAGRYDLRVRHAGTRDVGSDVHWFLDIEVPADRTRLKQIDLAQ